MLVDTGVGPPGSGDPFLEDRAGRLPALLAAAGVEPENVDLVVFTHLHVDHVGWNMLDGEPFFPSARYVAHRADFENFTAKYPDRRYVQDQLARSHAAGRLELIDGDFSPLPGVEIEHVPGHTAGQLRRHRRRRDLPRRPRRARAPARRSRRRLHVRGGSRRPRPTPGAALLPGLAAAGGARRDRRTSGSAAIRAARRRLRAGSRPLRNPQRPRRTRALVCPSGTASSSRPSSSRAVSLLARLIDWWLARRPLPPEAATRYQVLRRSITVDDPRRRLLLGAARDPAGAGRSPAACSRRRPCSA